MSYTSDLIEKLSKLLFPTGRAFRIPPGGQFEKLISGLAKSESRAYDDAVSILNSLLPDNDFFTSDDATDWERRLGLITNPSVSLADRKAALIRKINHPGTIKARQNYLYVQQQLQDAGFNVYVYENIFLPGPITKTPLQVSLVSGNVFQLGDRQLGQLQSGETYFQKVVNYIDEQLDSIFDEGSNLRNTFFIGGIPIGTYANVDVNRKNEFRQLILKLKPAQTVAYLFINFI